LISGTTVASDVLARFSTIMQVGCSYQLTVTGGGVKAARNPAFKWVNTTLFNIKTTIHRTYHAIRPKHVPR
jgi:hypothetical protein